MIACIDTNALMSMLSRTHPSRAILSLWVQGLFRWAVSNEVLSEYEEMMLPRIGLARWEAFLTALDLGHRVNGNLIFVQPDFRFGTIASDPDDNKFADCAITADADWIVTEDHHFDALHTAGYTTRPITPARFLAKLQPPPSSLA